MGFWIEHTSVRYLLIDMSVCTHTCIDKMFFVVVQIRSYVSRTFGTFDVVTSHTVAILFWLFLAVDHHKFGQTRRWRGLRLFAVEIVKDISSPLYGQSVSGDAVFWHLVFFWRGELVLLQYL